MCVILSKRITALLVAFFSFFFLGQWRIVTGLGETHRWR